MPDARQPPQHYRLDDLLIDITRQQVVRDGVEQAGVSGLSFRLLHYLLQQGTRVVGFDELIDGVWAPAHVGEETVTQRVKLLRHALGDDGRKARYVRSVRGQGYQLCSAPQPIDPPVPLAPGGRRYRALLPAALVVLAMLAALAWWLWPRSPSPAPSPLLQRAAYYAGIGQRDNNERAIALFRQRLQEAPDDSAALLGLSRAYAARACLYNGSPDDTVMAETLARRVIARAPANANAHAALAYAFDCRGDVAAALAGYERAVALDPAADASRASAAYLYERRGRLADALSANLAVREPEKVRFLALQVASNLSLLGYAAEAEMRYRHSFQLYPDNVFSNLAWPTFLFNHGRAGEAQAALDQAMARGTEHAGLHLLAAELALSRGDGDEAKRAVRRASALSPQGSWPATMAWAMGAEPIPPPARLLERAQALIAGLAQGSDAWDGIDACLLFELAGDRDSAFAALHAAIAAGYADAGYLRASPLFAGLRNAPAFEGALAGITASVDRERDAARAAGSLAMVTATP
ncbi:MULTISPECIES: winged helix-turn-helix domain-containing protein [unclassified Luteimonas]